MDSQSEAGLAAVRAGLVTEFPSAKALLRVDKGVSLALAASLL